MAKFIQEGKSIDYTPASAVTAGDLVVVGEIIGVAARDIAANKLGALMVEGVIEERKDASVIAIGDRLYWDPVGNPVGLTAGTGALTKSPSGAAIYAGIAVAAALTGDANARVALAAPERTHRLPVAAVAAAGSAQGDAAPLIEGMNVVTGADGTKGVRLPTAVAGMIVYVKGNTAGVLKVYPATGGAINGLSANGAISLASGLIPAIFVATSATQWVTIPLVPS